MSDNLTLLAQQGSTGASTEALLKVEGLTKHFPIYGGFPIKRKVGAVQAVDNVDLTVGVGESVGLVGESGCGKSTTGGSSPGSWSPPAGRSSTRARTSRTPTARSWRPCGPRSR